MFVWTKIGRGIENCCRNRWGNLYLYFLEIGCNSICIIDLREMDAAVLVTGPNFKSKFNKTARTCHTATCISNGCYLPGHDKLLLDTSPMWYLDVVPRCGTSMWYPDVVPRCGTQMWYLDVVPRCGILMLYYLSPQRKHDVVLAGRFLFFVDFVIQWRPQDFLLWVQVQTKRLVYSPRVYLSSVSTFVQDQRLL